VILLTRFCRLLNTVAILSGEGGGGARASSASMARRLCRRTKLPDLPSLIVSRCLVTCVVYRRTHVPRRHCNCQLMPTLALLPLQTGNDHRVVQGERGCNKSRKTAGCLLVSLRSLVVEIATTLSCWSSAAVSVSAHH